MKSLRIGLLLSLAVLAGCVPGREAPAPLPQTPPRPAPSAPQPLPAPNPQPDWRDIPLSPGAWSYRSDDNGSFASFGASPDAPSFVLRCDRAGRRLLVSRPGSGAGTITIRTSFAARSFALAEGGEAKLPASDNFLDGMAFSRGRFTVETQTMPMLVIPSWPEPARVVEDCRG